MRRRNAAAAAAIKSVSALPPSPQTRWWSAVRRGLGLPVILVLVLLLWLLWMSIIMILGETNRGGITQRGVGTTLGDTRGSSPSMGVVEKGNKTLYSLLHKNAWGDNQPCFPVRMMNTTERSPVEDSTADERLPLSRLTSSASSPSCPSGLRWRSDRTQPSGPSRHPDIDSSSHPSSSTTTNKSCGRKIPRIVHQTAKSRCLAPVIFNLTESYWHAAWRRLDGDDDEYWEYYFHDDDAIERLFQQEARHFPLLLPVTRHCLAQQGTAKADLWRYLVLWAYGGLYADLDTAPTVALTDDLVLLRNSTSNSSSNHNDTDQDPVYNDAWFVVEQYHLLSQYVMAVAPRHPLMWYAVHHALLRVLRHSGTAAWSAAKTTGPHALHAAMQDFVRCGDGQQAEGADIPNAVPGEKPIAAGTYVGATAHPQLYDTHDDCPWTVTAVGVAADQNQYIQRDVLGMHAKRAAYQRMGMRHFQDDKKHAKQSSCLAAIWKGMFSEYTN